MSRYSKRHYDEIARIIYDNTWGEQNAIVSDAFEKIFADDNPRFDRERWKKAAKHPGAGVDD